MEQKKGTGTSRPTGKNGRIPKATLFNAICESMNRFKMSTLPEFPYKFHVVEPSPGIFDVVEERSRGVVNYCHEQKVSASILKYCQIKLSDKPSFVNFTTKDAHEAMKFWLHMTRPVPKPELVREKSDEGLCFHRLPWDTKQGLCPLFDEILSRTSNADAYMSFIGSLFYPRSDKQQYLWHYGRGLNSKGSLIRLWRRILGPAFSAEDAGQAKSQFWTYGLIGKRLIVFPDCNSYSFPASQKFKSLTGGDPIRIERKNKDPYTEQLDAKFMFASNEKPGLSSQSSDIRRAIFCESGPIPGKIDPLYDQKLWEEAPAIIYKCRASYKFWCPNHEPIVADKDDLESIIEENEGNYALMFRECFDKDTDESKLVGMRYYTTQDEMTWLLNLRGVNKPERRSFFKWLDSQFDINYRKVRLNKKLVRRYVGCKLKTWVKVKYEGLQVYDGGKGI